MMPRIHNKHAVAVIVFTWSLLIIGTPATSQDQTAGKSLFQTHCAACHGIHKESTGPMLASITKKQTAPWLQKFIADSQDLIASGDEYAMKLYINFNHQVMPSFRDKLSAVEVDSILSYIEKESTVAVDEITSQDELATSNNSTVLAGHNVFQTQCASCHFIQHESFGPALGSVTKRHTKKWLHAFIRNSGKVIESGDPYAEQLYKRFDQRTMVSMEFLSARDIEAVLAYIEFIASSDHSVAGANGRRTGVSSTAEIHGAREDKIPAQKSFVFTVVALAVCSGVLLYSRVIVRGFNYLNRNDDV